MRDTTNFASGLMFAAVVAVLMSGLLASPLQLNAQNCSGSQGQNAVYNPTCTNPVTAAYSKFTSSPSTRNGDYQNNPPSSDTPTWGFGNKLPPTGAECSPVGAIYSQTTTTTSPKLVYVCVPVINQNYGQWNTIR